MKERGLRIPKIVSASFLLYCDLGFGYFQGSEVLNFTALRFRFRFEALNHWERSGSTSLIVLKFQETMLIF
jgi:hypothetical protein